LIPETIKIRTPKFDYNTQILCRPIKFILEFYKAQFFPENVKEFNFFKDIFYLKLLLDFYFYE